MRKTSRVVQRTHENSPAVADRRCRWTQRGEQKCAKHIPARSQAVPLGRPGSLDSRETHPTVLYLRTAKSYGTLGVVSYQSYIWQEGCEDSTAPASFRASSRTTLITCTRTILKRTAVGKQPASADDSGCDASVAYGKLDSVLVLHRHFVFSEIGVTLLASLATDTARSHLIKRNLLNSVHDSSCSCATVCLSIPVS